MRIILNKIGILIYLSLLVLALVFASFFGGPIAYGLLYAILLVLPVSILYSISNFLFLRVYQEIEVHKVTRGESYDYRVTFENAGILPVHNMSIVLLKDRCQLDDIEDGQQISLDIHEKQNIHSKISCRYAGAYNVGVEKVSLSDPFNLYTIIFDIPYTFKAIVRPQITDVAEKVLEIENMVNSTGLKSNKLLEEIPGSDLRQYRAGDSVASINWKVSARLSELVTRIPDKLEKKSVTILMEAREEVDKKQTIEFLKKRDRFLEFAVSAAWHFGQQGVPVKLIYPSGKIKEAMVDSYESFMDFYNVVADGVFYGSKKEFEEMKSLESNIRDAAYENDTWIIIREDPEQGEENCIIC